MGKGILVLSVTFYRVLFMSVAALGIGAVLLIVRRLADKKISPFWKYVMWLPCIIALLIPYRLESSLGLMEQSLQMPEISYQEEYERSYNAYEAARRESEAVQTEKGQGTKLQFPWQGEKVQGAEGGNRMAGLEKEVQTLYRKSLLFDKIIPMVWLSGVVLTVLFLLIGRGRLLIGLKKTRIETKQKHLLLLSKCKETLGVRREVELVTQKWIPSPALLGLFHPKILLPDYTDSMRDKSVEYVLLHELSHYKRGDMLVNYLLLALQAVYWFNPVVWYLFKMIRQDMELSNDAYVIGHIGSENRKEYSCSLIEILSRYNQITLAPKLLCMVDGKKNMERRIKMLKLGETFRKHKLLIGMVSLGLIVVVSVLFLTVRPSKEEDTVLTETLEYTDVDRIQIVMSMGNPAYGAEGKIITDEETLKQFIDIFNNARIEEEMLTSDDIKVAMPSYYYLYQGDELVKKFAFNGNDTGILWADGGYKAISYPEYLPTPYELYQRAEGRDIMVYDDRQVEQIGFEEYIGGYEGYLDEVNVKGSIGEDGNPAVCVAEKYDYDKDGTWDRLYRKILSDGKKIIELHFGDGTVLQLTETEDLWQSEIPYAYDVTGDGVNEIVYVGQHEGSTNPLAESEIVVYRKKDGTYEPLQILDDVALNPEIAESELSESYFKEGEKGICFFFYAGQYDEKTGELTVTRNENSQAFPEFESKIELKPEEIEYMMPWQENCALGGIAYTLGWLEYGDERYMVAYIQLGNKWGCHDVAVYLQYDEERDALVCKDMVL